MNLKKVALRGLIILAVVVALCMFLANTIMNITTPHISVRSANRGRFEDKMTFNGQVYFPSTEEIIVKEAAKTSIVVDKLYVRNGDYVTKGEIIFTTKMPSYEEDLEKLRKEYDTKAAALLALDIENRTASKASKQNELYDEMLAARGRYDDILFDTRALAVAKGINLTSDVSNWLTEAAAVNADQEMVSAIEKAQAMKAAFEEANKTFMDTYNNKTLRQKAEVFKYINDRNALIKEMEDLMSQQVALFERHQALTQVLAPRDGYITELKVQSGDTYDGNKAAYVMNSEGTTPVLRAEIHKDYQDKVAEGAVVNISGEYGNTEKTSVQKIETDVKEDKRYAYVELTDGIIRANLNLSKMLREGGTEMEIVYRAREVSTLLPVSVVREGEGGKAYVYIVENTYGGLLSGNSMVVRKQEVTVRERSDKWVSVIEDMYYQSFAEREDRALEDGMRVMEYDD